jgi:hypothetical protein
MAAAASGVLAENTSDLVPYGLLAVVCIGALTALRFAGRPGGELPDGAGDSPANTLDGKHPELRKLVGAVVG